MLEVASSLVLCDRLNSTLQSWLHAGGKGASSSCEPWRVCTVVVSGKQHDHKHLTPRLLLPAAGSSSRREPCSWDNNNQAPRARGSPCSQGSCRPNYSPPGQNHFHSINDPSSFAWCHCAAPCGSSSTKVFNKSPAAFCNSNCSQPNVFHGCAGGQEQWRPAPDPPSRAQALAL